MKIGEERFVGHRLEGQRHVLLEEADDSGELLQRHFRVDLGRILQILARGLDLSPVHECLI